MSHQVPLDERAIVSFESSNSSVTEVLPDIAYKRLAIVNASFIGFSDAGDRQWILVDAGLSLTTAFLRKALEKRFGKNSRPAAIIMTHGHADHAGGLCSLAEHYDAPVFAHSLEMPYLDGTSAYPPPDPGVGGGLMSLASPLFSRGPFDVRGRLQALPADGSVPFLPEWRWIHTPGHTVGHVSLWRESDAVLLSGDAFVSTDQESAYSVALQKPELHGPPLYYTVDWEASESSVKRLAGLEPEIAVTGHGPALQGPLLRESLHELSTRFREIARPAQGKYVEHPARVQDWNAYKRQ